MRTSRSRPNVPLAQGSPRRRPARRVGSSASPRRVAPRAHEGRRRRDGKHKVTRVAGCWREVARNERVSAVGRDPPLIVPVTIRPRHRPLRARRWPRSVVGRRLSDNQPVHSTEDGDTSRGRYTPLLLRGKVIRARSGSLVTLSAHFFTTFPSGMFHARVGGRPCTRFCSSGADNGRVRRVQGPDRRTRSARDARSRRQQAERLDSCAASRFVPPSLRS